MNTEHVPDGQQHKILLFSSGKYIFCYYFFLISSCIALLCGVSSISAAFSISFVTGYDNITIIMLVGLSTLTSLFALFSVFVWWSHPPVRFTALPNPVPFVTQPSLLANVTDAVFYNNILHSTYVPPQSVQDVHTVSSESDHTMSHPSTISASSSSEIPTVNDPPPAINLERKTDELKPFYSPTFVAYILPREGTRLERSQDKMAYDPNKARYAVTDGVGTSFLPGRWAEIIAERFVSGDCNFDNPQEITDWLTDCSKTWHTWVEEVWVPSAHQKNPYADWNREIAKGAATTLAGCSFSPTELAQKGTTDVQVVVVGDAEFFLLVQESLVTQPRWQCKLTWHLRLEELGHTTKALATRADRVGRDYKWVYVTDVEVKTGNCLVLATDALAKWILQHMKASRDPWDELFALRDQEDFEHFVHRHRSDGSLEVDDTTLMIVPLDGMIPSCK